MRTFPPISNPKSTVIPRCRRPVGKMVQVVHLPAASPRRRVTPAPAKVTSMTTRRRKRQVRARRHRTQIDRLAARLGATDEGLRVMDLAGGPLAGAPRSRACANWWTPAWWRPAAPARHVAMVARDQVKALEDEVFNLSGSRTRVASTVSGAHERARQAQRDLRNANERIADLRRENERLRAYIGRLRTALEDAGVEMLRHDRPPFKPPTGIRANAVGG